jgi:plastocyanin domain-containing protein
MKMKNIYSKKSIRIILGTLFVIFAFGLGFNYIFIKQDNLPSSENIQRVALSIQDHNYYPNTIKVKAGIPVEITLDSSIQGCFRNFNIEKLGISEYSSDPSEIIKFTRTQKGTFGFACGMRMAYGYLTVE